MTIVSYDVTEVGVSGSHTWMDSVAPVAPLPPVSYLETAHRLALTDPDVKRSLSKERGLNWYSITKHGIGWDPVMRAWVLPVRDHRRFVVNVIWRPRRGESMRWRGDDVWKPRRLAGRTAARGFLPLYPRVPLGNTWLLVAGEWDALVARQRGLPAVTGLLGCRWHWAWDEHVVGKRVAVAYDVGEERAADLTVRRLRSVGAKEAWPVHLPMPEKGDDPERWFRRRHGGYARTADEMIEVIAAARDEARHA